MTAALVTGGGKRIGRAIALALGADGYTVAVHYNSSADAAEKTVAEIEAAGGRAVAVGQDLARPEEIAAFFAQVVEAAGPVSVLVNSASNFDQDSLGTVTLESWQLGVDVNLTAPVMLMAAFARQDPLPEGAAIINLLDVQMASPWPERLSYFCGKIALEGATRLAAFDLARRGITVNGIAPGLVLPSGQTDEEYAARQGLTPMGPGLGPGDIVQAVRYLIAARQVTGHVLAVDAGQHLMGMGNSPIG